MKILIINYYFEPFVGAHAYRWSQIAKVWAAEGHEVEVIAGRVGDTRCEVRDDVTVERIGFVRRQSGMSSSSTTSSEKVNALRSATVGLLKKVNRFFFWPDGLWHWLPFLLASLLKRRHVKYDLVVSYSPTFSAHVGGLFFKKINKNIGRWIADYGDPFSTSNSMPPNNFKIYKWLNFFFENRVFKFCDKVVFTNKRTLREYVECFGLTSCSKASVIPHAVDVGAFFQQKKPVRTQPYNLVYVGAFHRGIREPFMMVGFFNELCKRLDIVVNVYGPLNGVPHSEVNTGCVKHHGAVSRDRAIELVREADILINIENSNCVMTPSKIVEYVATGLPIINFYEKERAELLCDERLSGRLLHVKNLASLDSACAFISRAVLERVSLDHIEMVLFSYSINNVADKYLDGVCE
ncbi:glycosyltransferase [Thiopseudomonas denitrificans]|uniref:Glycosyltransferase involved in cell wall biosynthesis n=1 Tax=Thiopseudomonas denitrificans TaxID=1501432 RepID=A0A4R6TXS2_9GAMM|nr:glycosyltransferase [Thiopseudomonas denitrificans]TDQ37592.1 glycosyltransferase involved in cell wall biosynthesis [Thiopseudomonas denitrificans]